MCVLMPHTHTHTYTQVLRPVVIALLRALVRSRTFWLRGLQQAYHDPGAVTDEVCMKGQLLQGVLLMLATLHLPTLTPCHGCYLSFTGG